MRRAFVRFALVSAGFLTLVVVGALLLAEALADRARSEDARIRGETLAATIELTIQDAGEPPFDEAFTESVEAASSRAGVRAVLVVAEDGTVVWASRTVLIGGRLTLDTELVELFEGGDAIIAASDADLDSARPSGLLGNEVQVYSPIVDGGGRSLVVKSYVDRAAFTGTRSETLLLVLPVAVGATIVFVLVALRAGTQLARRVQSGGRRRMRMLSESLWAVEHERTRLAQELHDGIVQDLAATRYALTSVIGKVPAELEGNPRARLNRVSELLDEELTGLRGMLGDLMPPDLEQLPLSQALDELVGGLVGEGVTWTVTVDPDVGTIPVAAHHLAHRVVQEGVRNAVRHASPSSVAVHVTTVERASSRDMVVTVVDDGRGPPARPPDVGHFGLRLLAGMASDLDGTLELRGRPEGGSRLEVTWTLPGTA